MNQRVASNQEAARVSNSTVGDVAIAVVASDQESPRHRADAPRRPRGGEPVLGGARGRCVAGWAGDPLKTRRREVAVVFLDLRGFTAFAETAEPEEVMGVLG